MASSFATSLCAVGGALALLLFAVTGASALAQPLPSGNEGFAKTRILAFGQAVTDKSGKDFDANAKNASRPRDDFRSINVRCIPR